jgi:glycosyltransferase involved in cell wall biosynthesis|nr:glycosyltransferase family 2 protein [uncultured Acetatifactor sp.]
MKVTIIVPIYKGNCYVMNIIKMVEENVVTIKRTEEHITVELLFINDSPDSPILIEGLNDHNSFDIRVINNAKNIGIHGSRVHGLREAKGEYILFLDQDDRIKDDCIISQLKCIGKADICIGNGYNTGDNYRKKIYRHYQKQRLATREEVFLKAACQIASPGQCLIRKEAIPQEWYEYIVSDNGADDFFLWILMFEKKKSFSLNIKEIYEHVNTGKNVSSDDWVMTKSAHNVISLMKKCGCIRDKSIQNYERRIRFWEELQKYNGFKKVIIYIKNIDTCIWKLYAYYR